MEQANTPQAVSATVDKKRVLLLVTQADWGGVQSFLIRFAARLKQEGYDVLLAAGGQGELWQHAKALGIPSHELRHTVREISPFKDLAAVFEIKRLIHEFKPNAIHLNSSKMGVLGSLAARISSEKPRVVYRIGGWVFLEPMGKLKKWFYEFAEKFSARFKDVIITVHPEDEKLAHEMKITPRGKIITVPNGLDVDGFKAQLLPKAEARNALCLGQDDFVFGTVANAYATKALLPYLDAVKQVAEKFPRARFAILGDGPEFAALKEKRTSLKLDNLILTGHRDDASKLYQAFDVFVLPSVKEGMPWTVLEAMSAGIPVVATDVGACRWMVEDGQIGRVGMIVPAQDNTALSETLGRLISDPQALSDMAKTGPEMVKLRFTWDATYRGNLDALS